VQNLGIEFISVFGMPPVAFVELAAELGCSNISIGFNQSDFNPHGYPRYSLKEDAALRRELKAALAANGVSIALGENLLVQPGVSMREQWLSDLEIFSELGVTRANSVSFEPDLQRNIDQYGQLAELTAGFGIKVLLEFVPIFGVADLPTALTVAEKVAHPNLGLIIDTMHVGRSGASADDLRAVPPELVGYIQLCDVPWEPEIPDYMYEAMFERKVPGEGELPLAEFLGELPCDRIVGLEIPLRAEAERGVGPRERLGRAVAAARKLLA
jgi:sugar phosphate isomerase/epimerase